MWNSGPHFSLSVKQETGSRMDGNLGFGIAQTCNTFGVCRLTAGQSIKDGVKLLAPGHA